MIATNAGAIGTLNIGAGAGNPAVASGTLTAPNVAFGAGTGTLNFNHMSANYVFAPAISGNGTVNVLAGTTTLRGANSYSGADTWAQAKKKPRAGGAKGITMKRKHLDAAIRPDQGGLASSFLQLRYL